MDSINMIGYDAVHPSDFVYDMPGGHGYYLLILTHTPLRFRDSDGERIYPARHAALFSPDARIHYGACEATYSNDWIIFDSDEPYVTQFPLQNRPFPVPDADYCHNLFQLLTWEHMQGSLEAVTAQLMELLFQKLRAGIDLPGEVRSVVGCQNSGPMRILPFEPEISTPVLPSWLKAPPTKACWPSP